MSVSASTLVLAASMALTLPALAAENCAQLPDALQSIAVNHIAQNSELLSLDNKLDTYIKPCLSPVTEQNKKAICAHGKLVAEQALRVVARIDQAGSRNPFFGQRQNQVLCQCIAFAGTHEAVARQRHMRLDWVEAIHDQAAVPANGARCPSGRHRMLCLSIHAHAVWVVTMFF